MTDIEKAIKFAENEIKSIELAPEINGCEMTEWWKEQIKVWKTAISALEKQIPKKVVPTQQPCKTRFACSICNSRLYNKQKFCDRCGQALDWGDSE